MDDLFQGRGHGMCGCGSIGAGAGAIQQNVTPVAMPDPTQVAPGKVELAGGGPFPPGPTRKVADRIVMLYPVLRLEGDEPQMLYDGPAADIDKSPDRRVTQFIRGEAGDRMSELAEGGKL